EKSNIIKVKQELDWYILIEYLESIRTFCPLFEDKKFSEMFQEMRAYAEDKIDVPYEIVDRYVTLEYKSN
ncbi:MAG: hypothetical protein K2I46_05085, partial [Clostridia bacterium]|nr:hypothetical protein [Clostridia bacterium]